MKKLLVIFLLTFLTTISQAFHIVGGEIEFEYIRDGRYRITLIQYFDRAQTTNPRPDVSLKIYIFRNGDNQLMSIHRLFFDSENNVEYTNDNCIIDGLLTSQIVYSAEISLAPTDYSSAEGYYIQWERFSRNEDIQNIVNPSGTGITYVLEIPPLMKNGVVFRNSSPRLFQPLRDYACLNRFYYVDLSGEDLDGDSLVYSLTVPLNSSAAVAVPIPQRKPHIEVLFRSGFSAANMLGGSPPLQISENGRLTVRPDQTGLYIFGVRIEEYRAGEKIGETRRDLQLLVVDNCAITESPILAIDIENKLDFNPETDTLIYTASDRKKCFSLATSSINIGESISFRVEARNLETELTDIDIFFYNDTIVTTNQIEVGVCIPSCFPLIDETFLLDFIVSNDVCPLPLMDTLSLMIYIESLPNNSPVASINSNTFVLNEGEFEVKIITGTDSDRDNLDMSLLVEGIENPANYGFDLTVTSNSRGNIQGNLTWNIDCLLFDFSEIQDFSLIVVINDADDCDIPGDSLFIDASLNPLINNKPRISTTSLFPTQVDLGTSLSIDILATDIDRDDLTLFFEAINFNAVIYGIRFPMVFGNTSMRSTFTWDFPCTTLFEDKQQFEFMFIVNDSHNCKRKSFDTLRHTIQVNYPENSTPHFKSINRNHLLRVNESVEIEIDALDSNLTDFITIEFAQGIRLPASQSLELEPVTRQGSAKAILKWKPECSLLRIDETSAQFDVVVQVTDDACPMPNIDTLTLTFEVFDDAVVRHNEFIPPNIFTPNGDGKNDVFSLFGNFDINQNLPPNNCKNTFEYVLIVNRLGIELFRSEARDFFWTGKGLPNGVYFYFIKYTNTDFKGYVSLLR